MFLFAWRFLESHFSLSPGALSEDKQGTAMFSDVEVIDLGDERGRALFSKRSWVEGEVIFKELPLMVVHVSNNTLYF